jgi:hypothetical protein
MLSEVLARANSLVQAGNRYKLELDASWNYQ